MVKVIADVISFISPKDVMQLAGKYVGYNCRCKNLEA